MTKIYFIGAGPGDPELITLKGKKIIDKADIIIYAGSLVNPQVLGGRKDNSTLYNSASMTLDEVVKVYSDAKDSNKIIARVHTGDPSIYGAIREQMDRCEDLKIDYEVIPGVSSFTAAASVLKKEFTLPGVSQTVICTRLEGRTAVPEDESLEKLASHKTSMAIFLSVQMMDDVVKKLLLHYDEATPIAVIQKATWEDEKIIRGTLADIAQKVRDEDIRKTAMILIGNFLGNNYELSKLYDEKFSHEYRDAK